jgi:hypothetical protein
MNNEFIKARGEVHVVLRDAEGNIKEERSENKIVDVGLAFIAQSVLKTTNSPVAMTHMAIGTSSTAAAANQTALVAEVGRASAAPTNQTTNVTNDAIQFIATFGAGVGTGTINEAAILNATPTGGTMLARTVFGGPITKGAADSMTVTWKITFTSAS